MNNNKISFNKLITPTTKVNFPITYDKESILYDAFHVLKDEILNIGYSEMIQYVVRNF